MATTASSAAHGEPKRFVMLAMEVQVIVMMRLMASIGTITNSVNGKHK
jgi:hypothetical protein